MCDFIRTENIKSLIEYIVTKHLLPSPAHGKSLEDIASKHVDTFKQLRQKYEDNSQPSGSSGMQVEAPPAIDKNLVDSHDTLISAKPILNKKALEDQVSSDLLIA